MIKQIITVLNQKGGVGKTTTTLNLGAYLARRDVRVLIMDIDPQANATSGLGLERNLTPSVYELLFGRASLGEVIKTTATDKLSIIPSSPNLASAEMELVATADREFKLKAAISGADFDVILVDCPPSLGLLTVNALTAANSVLIPVQVEYYALEGLSQLLSTIQLVRQGLNKDLEILGVVATMFDPRTSLSEQVYNELTKHFGDKMFKTVIPRNVRLAEAPSHGRTIAEHDRWSKGARAYKQLAKEVASRVSV